MAQLNVDETVEEMLKAAKIVLKSRWPLAKEYATNEFKQITDTIVYIQTEVNHGRMTQETAKSHLDGQKNTTKMVLLTLEGLDLLVAEAAINAALNAVRGMVNKALGVDVL